MIQTTTTEVGIDRLACQAAKMRRHRQLHLSRSGEWARNNPERASAGRRRRYLRDKLDPGFRAKQTAAFKARRKADPGFRISCDHRRRVRGLLMYGAVSGGRYCDILGCTPGQAVAILTGGLSFVPEGLQMDHYVPCAYFDLTDEAQQLICFNWRNTRLITNAENHKKYAKVPDEAEAHLAVIRSALSLDSAFL